MPTLKGTEASLSYVQSFLYLVSSSINISIFHITWLNTDWTDVVHHLFLETQTFGLSERAYVCWAYHHLIAKLIIEGVREEPGNGSQAVHNVQCQASVVPQHHQQRSHVCMDLIDFYGSAFQKLV